MFLFTSGATITTGWTMNANGHSRSNIFKHDGFPANESTREYLKLCFFGAALQIFFLEPRFTSGSSSSLFFVVEYPDVC